MNEQIRRVGTFAGRCVICLAVAVFVLSLPKIFGGDSLDEEQAAADHTEETIAAARRANEVRVRDARAEWAQMQAKHNDDANRMTYPLALYGGKHGR